MPTHSEVGSVQPKPGAKPFMTVCHSRNDLSESSPKKRYSQNEYKEDKSRHSIIPGQYKLPKLKLPKLGQYRSQSLHPRESNNHKTVEIHSPMGSDLKSRHTSKFKNSLRPQELDMYNKFSNDPRMKQSVSNPNLYGMEESNPPSPTNYNSSLPSIDYNDREPLDFKQLSQMKKQKLQEYKLKSSIWDVIHKDQLRIQNQKNDLDDSAKKIMRM